MCVCAKLFANIEFFYWIFHFLSYYSFSTKRNCLPSSSSLLIVEFFLSSFFLNVWLPKSNYYYPACKCVSNTHHPSKHPHTHTYFAWMVLDYGKKNVVVFRCFSYILFSLHENLIFFPQNKKKEENGKPLKFTFFFLSRFWFLVFSILSS